MNRSGRIEADLVIVGGGIGGLATARAVRARWPQLRLVLLEKEDHLARHQTGHNSGVVHAGLYYRPGSLKARLCTQGGRMLRAYCRAHDLPYQACGKVVTATRTVHGEVEAGPNAVLAFAREGYRWRDVNGFDLAHRLAYPGFWRLAARYGGTGASEMARSLNRRAFVRSLQRLMPGLRADEVRTGGAGVRAQAVDAHGRLVDDFHVVRTGDALHVLNAPSPAATASLAIGEHLAGQLAPLLS